MTNLERDASEIVADFHRAVRASCGISDSDRMSFLNHQPYIERIMQLIVRARRNAISDDRSRSLQDRLGVGQ